MSDTELIMLRAIWEEQDVLPRQAAWRSASGIIRARRRQQMLDDARARLGAWINNYLSAYAVEYGNFLINQSGTAPASVRQSALPPMLDAVAATVAGDELDPREHAVLMEPLTNLATNESPGNG